MVFQPPGPTYHERLMLSPARRYVLPLALLAAIAIFFLIANRGAYKGYFDADDFSNLNVSRQLQIDEFVRDLLSTRVFSNNFRPAGHLFYHWMNEFAGLDFRRYIAAIHFLHIINVLVLWLVLRKLGFEFAASIAGTLFFAFEIAVFDAYWKPMYVFDLLCGAFCLLSFLAYLNNWIVPSLAALIFAFRAKEVAIMLPVVFALYEFGLGKKRWKRLILFFAVSLLFGVQALLANQFTDNDYTLRFSPAAIWKCILFYASKLFLIPYAGFVVLLLPFLVRDRRLQFGIASFCVLMTPMLLLPGRLFAVYLYVPLIGLAVAMAALAAGRSIVLIAAFFALWLPWNYVNLRWSRRAELAAADMRRAFSTQLANVARQYPSTNAFLLINTPLSEAAISDAIQLLHNGALPVVCDSQGTSAWEVLGSDSLVVLEWEAHIQKLHALARSPSTPDTSYITMDLDTPVWQLERGWLPREGKFRWTKPSASARLRRPDDAKQFEVVLNVNQLYIDTLKHSHLDVRLDDIKIGDAEITHVGQQPLRWNVAPGPGAEVEVKFDATPAYPGSIPLGVAVASFGFLPR